MDVNCVMDSSSDKTVKVAPNGVKQVSFFSKVIPGRVSFRKLRMRGQSRQF